MLADRVRMGSITSKPLIQVVDYITIPEGRYTPQEHYYNIPVNHDIVEGTVSGGDGNHYVVWDIMTGAIISGSEYYFEYFVYQRAQNRFYISVWDWQSSFGPIKIEYFIK